MGRAMIGLNDLIPLMVELLWALIVVVVVLSIAWFFAARGAASEGARLPMPGFALVFLALVLVNSLGLVPAPLKTALVEASRAGLLLAIAALGLATSLGDIARSGWRQAAVVTGTTFVILIVVTGGLMAMR